MGRAKGKRIGARDFAISGIIFVGLIIALLFWVGSVQADSQSHLFAENAAEAYQRSARIEAKSSCGDLPGVEKPNCVERILSRARDKERQEYELEANRKAANWTAAAGRAAVIGLIFTPVTILVIFLTFQQEAINSRISLNQLTTARKSARDAIAHARRHTALELRPYVFVDKITPEAIGERQFNIVVWLRNFGRTPARNMHSVVTTYVTRDVHKLKPLKTRKDRIELGTAPPDGCRRAIAPLDFSDRQWNSPPYDRFYAVLRIQYSYTDDDENPFEEAFDYYIEPSGLRGDNPTFFLLTPGRIRAGQRIADRQGSLLPYLRKRANAEWRSMKEEAAKNRAAQSDDSDDAPF